MKHANYRFFLTAIIAPIALPSGNEVNENFAGETAVASGYGLTESQIGKSKLFLVLRKRGLRCLGFLGYVTEQKYQKSFFNNDIKIYLIFFVNLQVDHSRPTRF